MRSKHMFMWKGKAVIRLKIQNKEINNQVHFKKKKKKECAGWSATLNILKDSRRQLQWIIAQFPKLTHMI